MGYGYDDWGINIIGIFFILFLVCGLVYTLWDDIYVEPVAKENANNYCKSLEFDQYKTFSRVGFWSENPIAIKCEYAERYTDLGVRTTSS